MNTDLSSLLERYPTLQACERELRAAFDLLAAAYRNGNKLLVCGNGGSAADSEHIVGELMKGFLKRRPLPPEQVAKLEAVGGEAMARRLQGSLPAISLPSQMSLLTATANDGDYDLTFAQQVYGLGRAGDVLLAISTSGKSRNVCNAVIVAKAFDLKSIALTGKSKNVCNAVIVAKAFDLKSIALTGKSGGELATLADIAIKVPSDNVAEIQELHLPVYHWLSTELEATFFAE